MSISKIHTQASNFMDFIKTGVDARTGQFSMAIQLPLIPANNLAGPSLSPTLSFSVLGSSRNRGFGRGWSLDLSELNLNQHAPSLRLSSGEQFAVDLDESALTPGSELLLFDEKLKSMVITCLSETEFRVSHKSGQTEILTRQQDSARYLVSEIRSPEGRRIFVEWSAFGNDDFILEAIRDESRTLLQIISADGEVQFVVPPLASQALRLQLTNDKLSDMFMHGIDVPFSLVYADNPSDAENDLLLPTEIKSPLGAVDWVTWGTGEYGHQLPDGGPFETLPRVVEWKHSAGSAETELTRSYEWLGVHNFLGYGSDQAFDWQQGRDNLYEVEQDYAYEVLEQQTDYQGNVLATIGRTWNRFHLLTEEVVRREHCEVRTQTLFAIEADTPWKHQPGWCQLPHEQTVTYIDHRAPALHRSDTTTYRYDAFGNLVFTRSPAGVEQHSEYYPAEGAEGCPANALGMVRYLKKKTVKPALLEDGTCGGASEISTAYAYTSLPSLIDGEPELVLVESEQVRDETHAKPVETTTQRYVTERECYARLKNNVTWLSGKATTTTYHYEFSDDELSTHVVVSGFENTKQVRQSHSSARSLLTGKISRDRNLAGVLSRYTYDALGRVTLVVTADDSRYRTTRATSYHVSDAKALALRHQNENPLLIEHVHATGQHRREWLDGEGRTVRVELEDIDHAPGQFREVARTVFDAQGRPISETQTDWLREADNPATVTELALTTLTEYDNWGQTRVVTGPDGVQTHTEHNPAQMTVKQWHQNGDLKGPSCVSRFNSSGNAISERVYDTDNRLIRATEWTRDGLDRIVETRVKIPGGPDRVTSRRLDVYGRILEQKLPDASLVSWSYAQHSDDNHPESIAVTPA